MTTMLRPETDRSTNDLGLPPPAFELTDGDRVVGWIAGPAMGFLGFGSEIEAAHAAWVAYRTMARRRARRDGSRPVPIDSEPLSLALRGDEAVILASGRPIATLVRPGEGSRSGQDAFGFEIRVPPPASAPDVRAMTHLVYRTLRKSGLRWALWQPAARLTTHEPRPAPAAIAQPAIAPRSGGATRPDLMPDARRGALDSRRDAGLGAGTNRSLASDRARGDHTTQHGGGTHAIRHPERRPWWRAALPWRRAAGPDRGPERGAARLRQ